MRVGELRGRGYGFKAVNWRGFRDTGLGHSAARLWTQWVEGCGLRVKVLAVAPHASDTLRGAPLASRVKGLWSNLRPKAHLRHNGVKVGHDCGSPRHQRLQLRLFGLQRCVGGGDALGDLAPLLQLGGALADEHHLLRVGGGRAHGSDTKSDTGSVTRGKDRGTWE
eukprot:280293-Chlamydomonas_euryale.AAC.1